MPLRSYTQGERKKQVEALEKVLTDLIAQAPRDEELTDNDAFMGYAVDLMNVAMKALHYACAIAPSTEVSVRGYLPNPAIVLGHLVRLRKLFEGFLGHIANNQLELALVFARPMHETVARMEYLMKAKASSFRSFKLASYRPEQAMLKLIPKKHDNPMLDKIAKRWRTKVGNRLRRDGITLKELMGNRVWNVDGLDFYALLRELGQERDYSFKFGNASHSIHGDWADLDWYHLRRDGRRYHPVLAYATPDLRAVAGTTAFALIAAAIYVRWARTDPSKRLRGIMQGLTDELLRLDALHEATL